jgi:hypothetical protein
MLTPLLVVDRPVDAAVVQQKFGPGAKNLNAGRDIPIPPGRAGQRVVWSSGGGRLTEGHTRNMPLKRFQYR